MIEVRFHGRGGQGAVTSAELLALAAIADGKCAQAFPSFGPERRGAPVLAFARVSESVIRNRTAIREPGVVVVLDPSLIKLIKVDQGLLPGGTVVVNTARKPEEIRTLSGIRGRLALVDANRIAREEIGRTITNTAMLGALLSAVPIVPEARMENELSTRFGPIAVKNIAAFRRARKECVIAEAV